MLSDEEREAIESLKNIAIYIEDNYTFSQQGIRNLRENLRIVLPVIEKQSKEIEELKKPKYVINCKTNEITKLTNDFVSKDKIKAKMKEKEWSLENYDCNESDYKQSQAIGAWSVLQSLLEKEVNKNV